MRGIALFGLFLAACGPNGGSDAGTDAGGDAGQDGGPVCTGVPAHLTQYTCVEASGFFPLTCQASWAQTLAGQTADCDAGAGILGHVAVSHCDGLDSVSWVYGFPGDTYQCFYGADGGGWTGGINYSDHGVMVAGRVADCADEPPPSCKDGG